MQPHVVVQPLLVLLLLAPQTLAVLPRILRHRLLLERRAQALGLRVMLSILRHGHPLKPPRHLLSLVVVLMGGDRCSEAADGRDTRGADRRGALRDGESRRASAHHCRRSSSEWANQWLDSSGQVR